jgi:hypothetical protein
MSLFKSELPVLGRATQIVSGVPGASGGTSDLTGSTNLLPLQYEVPIFVGQSTVSATALCFFVSDDFYQIVKIQEVHDTASSSGTVDIKKAASGVAVGSAVTVLASTISTATTAATPQAASLSTTTSAIQLNPGDRLYFVGGGTQTSLAGCSAQISLKRIA